MPVRFSGAVPSLVLFDRDGTLVVDRPMLDNPSDVCLMDGAREAVARLRTRGIALGVVTNQPRLGLGTLEPSELAAVHAEIERKLGALDLWAVCPHPPADGCGCRKPMPGLIVDALRRLGRTAQDCIVVGDIGSDMEAAAGAGVRAILIPTSVTRREEIERATVVARDLREAVDVILGEPT